MDKKACVWLFNNLDRYQFNHPEAIELRDSIRGMNITETTMESVGISDEMEKLYSSFFSMFYNNIYGYQNGIVNKPILSPYLDCYFIETSEGFLPIGYYKIKHPAETVLIVQRYLEICGENIITEKNRFVIEWQNINGIISQKYDDIKNTGTPSMVKAVLGLISSLMLLAVCIISFVKMDLLSVILNSSNPNVLEKALYGVPIISGGDMGVWLAYMIFVIVCLIIVIVGALCTVREFVSLKEKKTTEDFLANVTTYVNTLDGGINYVISNGNEMIQSAIRKGENLVITPNGNYMLIAKVNRQMREADDFVAKSDFQRSGIWYALIAVIFLFFVLLTLTHIPAFANGVNPKGSLGSSSGGDSNSISAGGDASVTPDTKVKVSRYITQKENVTWTEAQSKAQYEGGNIISINDYAEFEKACALAEQAGLTVCWVGSRINSGESWDNAKTLDGKELYVASWFSKNGVSEPTYTDAFGNEELYLMIFKVNGVWYYNDAANDAIAASQNRYSGKIGYIIEIEE